jgi:DNA-binding MarR family transcriptional regulator
MGQRITPDDITRLMSMVDDVSRRFNCSVPEAIDLICRSVNQPDQRPFIKPSVSSFAANTLKFRHTRSDVLGAPMFRDPSWDMLLDLVVQQDAGRVVSVSSLCLASGTAPSTALRHIDRLVHHGILVRHGDDCDARRTLITLSREASTRLHNFLAAWVDSATSKPRRAAPPTDKEEERGLPLRE